MSKPSESPSAPPCEYDRNPAGLPWRADLSPIHGKRSRRLECCGRSLTERHRLDRKSPFCSANGECHDKTFGRVRPSTNSAHDLIEQRLQTTVTCLTDNLLNAIAQVGIEPQWGERF